MTFKISQISERRHRFAQTPKKIFCVSQLALYATPGGGQKRWGFRDVDKLLSHFRFRSLLMHIAEADVIQRRPDPEATRESLRKSDVSWHHPTSLI